MDAIKEAMIRAEDRGDNEEYAGITVADLDRLTADLDAKNERMLTLEWRLVEMVALMQGDIDGQKITAGETRLKIIDECRDLLGLKGR